MSLTSCRAPSSEVSATSATLEATRLARAAIACSDGVLLCCESNAEGILSAVGVGYLARAKPQEVRLSRLDAAEPTFGETAVEVRPDVDLARRVYSGFERSVARGCSRARSGRCHGGCEGACGRKVLLACASDDPDAPQAVERYLRLAFSIGPKVRRAISNPEAAPMLAIALSVSNECEKMRQFARFQRLSDGSFLARISPKADVTPFVAGYFAARLGTERFCLVDTRHGMAAFSEGGRSTLALLDEQDIDALASRHDLAPDERYVEAMWKRLYDSLELQGRSPSERGYNLRAQFMPKRLWNDLPEFDPRNDDPGSYVPDRYSGSEANAGMSLNVATTAQPRRLT